MTSMTENTSGFCDYPHAFAELPECPQLWPRLIALDLSHNALGGAVPEAALASMTQLQRLDISFQVWYNCW